jgi:hypothetical protein
VHVHVERFVSVVKMAAVREGYTTEKQCSVVCLLWAKGLNGKDIHEEMFPVYSQKCLPHEVVPPW